MAGSIAPDLSGEHTSIAGYSVRSIAMVAKIASAQADGAGSMNDREGCIGIDEVLFGVWCLLLVAQQSGRNLGVERSAWVTKPELH